MTPMKKPAININTIRFGLSEYTDFCSHIIEVNLNHCLYTTFMNYFLAKTDPDTYSLADFQKEGTTLWDGVHNNAAMLFIQKMRPGDLVYIYESLSTKAIVGLAEVIGEPFLNTADPRRSWATTLKFVKKYTTPLPLAAVKADPALADFALVKQSRLSVMPVPTNLQKHIDSLLT